MQYGDEIQVLASGPIISPKALKPLGISDGSICWGLWTGGLSVRNPERFDKNPQIPHLIISPIHPEEWAISFHIRAILRDNQGSLYRFLDSFRQCGVELHFSDCAFSGYDHVVFNAIGQFDELRDWRTRFVEYYCENPQVFNRRWATPDTATKLSQEEEPLPVFRESLIRAIGATNVNAESKKLCAQTTACIRAVDAMRRHALEWHGRKMLARMTALWVVIRLKEYELYRAAWDKEVSEGKRLSPDKWKHDPEKNIDPEGDYFFTSKTIQTGRRPWNMALPFHASWIGEENSVNRTSNKSVRKLWETFPSIISELEQDKVSWFTDAETKIQTLYDLVCDTKDLIHATRDSKNGTRLTREAELAKQQGCCNGWINAVLERTIRHNWIMPYSAYALYELAYTSIWRRDEDPIEFRYDASRSQLVVQNANALKMAFAKSEFLKDLEGPRQDVDPETGSVFPRVAVAAFNTKERFVRLKFIRRAISDAHIVNVDVNFKVLQKNVVSDRSSIPDDEKQKVTLGKGQTATSRGLLRVLCKAALELDLDLIRTSTRLKAKYPPHMSGKVIEEGVVEMVGQLPRALREGDNERLERYFRTCIDDHQANIPWHSQIRLTAKVTPWQVTRVFWSSVFSHDRHSEIFNLVEEVGESFGLDVIKSESRINETTRSVCDEIEKCDAVLQLICLREADRVSARDSENWQPEYVWLHSEYAMALALKKPVVRVIDQSMPERIRREFDKVDRDVPIEPIDLRCSVESLRTSIEGIMSELRMQLSARSHGNGG